MWSWFKIIKSWQATNLAKPRPNMKGCFGILYPIPSEILPETCLSHLGSPAQNNEALFQQSKLATSKNLLMSVTASLWYKIMK